MSRTAMDDSIFFTDIIKAIEEFRKTSEPVFHPLYFFTGGTGIPDKLAVDYYKDTSIIVVTRDGSRWQHGEKIE